MHGPCGSSNYNSPCMVDGKCSKHFPKNFNANTTIDEEGYPVYRRRDDRRTVEKGGVLLDNRYVGPHKVDLIVKYQAHINVEWCNRSRAIKYLFKYINKGVDRGILVLENDTTVTSADTPRNNTCTDEIKRFLDCRYISATEACWRIYEFDIHYHQPSVERLTYHLPNE